MEIHKLTHQQGGVVVLSKEVHIKKNSILQAVVPQGETVLLSPDRYTAVLESVSSKAPVERKLALAPGGRKAPYSRRRIGRRTAVDRGITTKIDKKIAWSIRRYGVASMYRTRLHGGFQVAASRTIETLMPKIADLLTNAQVPHVIGLPEEQWKPMILDGDTRIGKMSDKLPQPQVAEIEAVAKGGQVIVALTKDFQLSTVILEKALFGPHGPYAETRI